MLARCDSEYNSGAFRVSRGKNVSTRAYRMHFRSALLPRPTATLFPHVRVLLGLALISQARVSVFARWMLRQL